MAKTPIFLKRIPLLSFLLCLAPLLVGIGLGVAEYKTATQIENEGITASAVITDAWTEKGGWRRREKYYLQYEFELQPPDGGRITTSHIEEISRSHYRELQSVKSVEIRYLPSEPLIVRSEKYSVSKFAVIFLWLSIAGVLFLPGWAAAFVLLVQSMGRDHPYSKYVAIIPILAYIGLLIDLLSESTLHNFGVVFFMSLIMPIGAASALVIGDVFHIPWLSDFKPRE